MNKITHINATTIAEATSALGANAAVIAGGQDILGELKAMISPNSPTTLVNIKGIPGLSDLTEDSGGLKIGTLVTLTEIAESAAVKSGYAALAEAARRSCSPEIRNIGTIGGNICQKIRCWYYRAEFNGFDCLRKNPSGICNALVGDNRFNSIFGTLEGCVAVNPGDIAPALVAYNASVVTSKRTIAIDDFFAYNGERTTALDDDEMVTEIQVPTPAAGTTSATLKFALRKSFDFPIVNCSVVISGSDARICLNAVYNLPIRATEAEDIIRGQTINEANATAAGEAAVAGATALPGGRNTYMIQVAKTLVKRAILAAA